MGPDRVVRTTYRHKPGFLERLGNSFLGSAAGFVLFLISFYVLYSNEIRSVEISLMLDEGLKMVVPVNGGGVALEETHNQLIHITGPLESGILADPKYPVAVPCVRLSRKVEMYQWVEHSEVKEYTEGNEIREETIYSYTMEWSPALHKSKNFAEEFGHRNPAELPVSELNQVSDHVTVSGFDLSSSLINKINWFQELVRLSEPPPQMNLKVHDKYYYNRDPMDPQVGDVRVFFQCAGIAGKTRIGEQDKVSVVAQNSGGRLVPFRMPKARSIEILHQGVKSPEEVFKSEQDSNSTLTWGLRFAGWLVMFVGLNLITSVLRTVVDWIPIIRNIISASVLMFNLSLSVFLSLITIAVGWFFSRPMFSAVLAAAAFVPWYFSQKRAQAIHAYRR